MSEQRRLERRARELARRVELRRLRSSRTVKGTLRRAWLAGRIDAATHRRLRRIWWTANRARGRLTGTRRAELGAVIAMTEQLAATRTLTTSRMEAVFLTLRRNRDFWLARALPRPSERFRFGRDPVVFQHYAGRGLALQPLASFGRANALAGSCLQAEVAPRAVALSARAAGGPSASASGSRAAGSARAGASRSRAARRTPAPHYRCRPRALRRLLDRMVSLGADRGGFLAWEYYFAFGGGAAPWISGMTQATGAQALARGRVALHAKRYGVAARRALGAFQAGSPVGVAAPDGRILMYSFAPGLRILNGELQGVIGLRDTATLLRDARAQRLFARAERAARPAVAAFDTGAWSLYSWRGAESTLGYHRLLGGFLTGLCDRTGLGVYCATGQRFARYVREPPRVGIARLRGVRVRRRTTISFSLSKVSTVNATVWGRRGLELRSTLRLARGAHSLSWLPRRRGRHHLRIVAIGPAGTRAVYRRTVIVKRVPPRCRAAPKRSPAAKAKAKTKASASAKRCGAARA